MRAILELHKPRARTLRELADQVRLYLVADSNVPYEVEAIKKHLKDDDVRERLRELRNTLASVEPFDVPLTEQALRALAERIGVSAAKMIHPLRLALTGRSSSPPIFDVAVLLGRQRTLRRLDYLIDHIPELTHAR